MLKKGFFKILSLHLLVTGIFISEAKANSSNCQELLKNSAANLQKFEASKQNLNSVYKKSDLAPHPRMWLKMRQMLQKGVAHLENPLEDSKLNAEKINSIFRRFSLELPLLRELIDLKSKMELKHYRTSSILLHSDYIKLKRSVVSQLLAVNKKPHSHLQIFASLEAIKIMSAIEQMVEFPPPPEETTEKQKKPEPPKKQNQTEPEEAPRWNKNSDIYKPENKDLAQGSGSKKSVDIVTTKIKVHKNLLRQAIHDRFDHQDWRRNPVIREEVISENTSSGELTINPLDENTVDIPIPYNYTLKPGIFSDHKVIESAPGEFKLLTNSKTPLSLKLYKVLKETHLASLPKTDLHLDYKLENWPEHLLLFTKSLKNLSPIEAASRLELYISKDGGFLYYSEGDKIDKKTLQQIDQKYKQLLSQIPKPMAMAHVAAFNCDGAAWIGALLLRDVLNIPVRIAAGRTSIETYKNKEILHVVRSADPAHAWIEVYDGHAWIPFDMTPKNNAPHQNSTIKDVEREPNPNPNPQDENKNTKKEDKQKEHKESKDKEGSKEDAKKQEPNKDTEDADNTAPKHEIEEILNSITNERQTNERTINLVNTLLKKSELMFLENLIHNGYQSNFKEQIDLLHEQMSHNPSWKNSVKKSAQKTTSLLANAQFAKFKGLTVFLNELRSLFSENKTREARHKLQIIKSLLLSLAEYRNLTPEEFQALKSIERIDELLKQIKHKNSKEYDITQNLLQRLPGNISKMWLIKQYGIDYDLLGSSANIQFAHDLVNGKLQPLLQMAALRDFVEMNLNSTLEPRYKEEPTFDKSLIPKPRQDLVITRNPLDFARMLWQPRPGEHLFAPTFQGRQFAMGSLETRTVVNPKNPFEKKISMLYYDISPSMDSMGGQPIIVQDAFVMAAVDMALSELDVIGRPIHEIYLTPFNDELKSTDHIASVEDALDFITKRMTYHSPTSGGTEIQKVLVHFYTLIAESFKNKSKLGRDKLFQKANLILATDGGSQIDLGELEKLKNNIPPEVKINMNYFNFGDTGNETLDQLAQNDQLSTSKPNNRKIDSSMLESIATIGVKYDPDAFATNQKISGNLWTQLQTQIKQIQILPSPSLSRNEIQQKFPHFQITEKEVHLLSGLKETSALFQFQEAFSPLKFDTQFKMQLVDTLIQSYPRLTQRSWSEMTYPEKSCFERLRDWAFTY